MGMPYTVLMPVIVSTVLHGGPSTLGLLMTASGIGALGGALYLASRESVVGLGRVSTISTIAFGAGLIAFASTRSEVVALLVLPIVGAGLMVQMGSHQHHPADHRRRSPARAGDGVLHDGVLRQRADRQPARRRRRGSDRRGMDDCALRRGLCRGGLWFARRLPTLRALVRPIYIERGILPVPAVDSGAKTL